MSDKNALGLNRIRNKIPHPEIRSTWFMSTFKSYMVERMYPTQRKRNIFIMPTNVQTLNHVPSSYRPTFLLNTIGKIFERVIDNSMLPFVKLTNGFSERQYRHRRAHSTVDAIAIDLAPKALTVGKFCSAVTLDVRNGLNCIKTAKKERYSKCQQRWDDSENSR